jgi:HEAT repeat protein
MARPSLVFIVTVLLACLGGCGRGQPTLAGGKPVGHWVEALRSKDARVRREAVFKLGNVGPADAAAFPAVSAALGDKDWRVRREAILALTKFGPEAREAVPTLTRLRQRDPNALVRAYAAKAFTCLSAERAASE